MLDKISFGCRGICRGRWDQPTRSALLDVLNHAVKSGITSFDTAKVYSNDAEDIFGELAEHNLEISTKIPSLERTTQTVTDRAIENFFPLDYLKLQAEDSVKKLGKIDILYLHNRSEQRDRQMIEKMMDTLSVFKDDWTVKHLGVSLHDNYQGSLEWLLSNNHIEYVQTNHNIMNDNTSLIEQLTAGDKKVVIRWLLQQGLLVKDLSYGSNDPRKNKHESISKDVKHSLRDCLAFGAAVNPSKLLIGMTKKEQVDDLLSVCKTF